MRMTAKPLNLEFKSNREHFIVFRSLYNDLASLIIGHSEPERPMRKDDS